ncbi:hypothetical protein PC121_g25484, partial [Phytophthora cactorum]
PLLSSRLPEDPVLALPLLKLNTPDRPAVPPEAVPSEIEPLVLPTLRPLNTLTEPPVPLVADDNAVESPAVSEMVPPDNTSPAPTDSEIDPPWPPVDTPVFTETDPLSPTRLAPLVRRRLPLTPLVTAASGVVSEMSPLDDFRPAPLCNEIDPPVSTPLPPLSEIDPPTVPVGVPVPTWVSPDRSEMDP